MDMQTKMFEAILKNDAAGMDALRVRVGDEAWADDVAFVFQAMDALGANTKHEGLMVGARQCGYDDAIYEGVYEFGMFECQCPECERDYQEGWAEGFEEGKDESE